jgi:hypothetical protein
MAPKARTEGGERSNRFRFVMLEADLSDTNVNVLAQAIVSALRPEAPPTAKRLMAPQGVAPRVGALPVAPSNGRGEQVDDEGQNSPNEEMSSDPPLENTGPSSATASPAQARVRKQSKPAQPKYIDDLFPSAADSDAFKAFVEQHPPKKLSERYLVASLYLRDRGHATVNMDKIYTCYRAVGWPMDLKDWDVTFRNQLRNDRFRRADGGYAITTAGENVVRELQVSA